MEDSRNNMQCILSAIKTLLNAVSILLTKQDIVYSAICTANKANFSVTSVRLLPCTHIPIACIDDLSSFYL